MTIWLAITALDPFRFDLFVDELHLGNETDVRPEASAKGIVGRVRGNYAIVDNADCQMRFQLFADATPKPLVVHWRSGECPQTLGEDTAHQFNFSTDLVAK